MYIKHFKLEIDEKMNAELQKIAFEIHKQCLSKATNELYAQYQSILHDIEYETNQLLDIDEFSIDPMRDEILFDIDTIYDVHYSSRAFFKEHPFFMKYDCIKIFPHVKTIVVKYKGESKDYEEEKDEKNIEMIEEFLTYLFPDDINRIVGYTLDREVDLLRDNLK